MSKLEQLLAPLLAYPRPENGDKEEQQALVALCRPQFEALGAYLVSLPPGEVEDQARAICAALSADNSPYQDITDNGPIASMVATLAISNAVASHPECSDAQRHQVFHALAYANLPSNDRPRPARPRTR